MKKYILRLIILLAFTGAFYIKIVNQLVFALLALMCLGYLCKNGKVEKRNFVFLSLIFLLVIVGLYNTEGRLDNPNVPMYYLPYTLNVLRMHSGFRDSHSWNSSKRPLRSLASVLKQRQKLVWHSAIWNSSSL